MIYPVSYNINKKVKHPAFFGVKNDSPNNTVNNISSCEKLIEKRDKIIQTKQTAQKILNRALNYNAEIEKQKMLIEIKREKRIQNTNILKKLFSNDDIENKYYTIYANRAAVKEHVIRNKEFYENVILESDMLLEYIDNQLEKITGIDINVLLATIGIQNTQNVNSKKIKPENYISYAPKIIKNSVNTNNENSNAEILYNLEKTYKELPENSSEKREVGKRIYEMSKLMEKNNISFILKPPASFPNDESKIEYLQTILNNAEKNSASASDALSLFEEYGYRYSYPTGQTTSSNAIMDLSVSVDSIIGNLGASAGDSSVSKFIDILNKIGRNDGKYADNRALKSYITDYGDILSESTIIKMIKTLKKFPYERGPAEDIRYYIIESSNRTAEELERIKKEFSELEEIVKDMPIKDKTKLGYQFL